MAPLEGMCYGSVLSQTMDVVAESRNGGSSIPAQVHPLPEW